MPAIRLSIMDQGVRGTVPLSQDIVRVRNLPRRILDPSKVLDATPLYRFPNVKLSDSQISLWPLQSAALLEASLADGLFAPLAVGVGKTLITLLLPDAMNSDRAVLMIPPQLREQLFKRMYPEYRKYFKLPELKNPYDPAVSNTRPSGLYVVAYTELSSAKKADVLEQIDPDLVILDECHYLRHRSAARTKRFLRFFKTHPECRLAALSGTITSRSILDYAHLLVLALRKNAPIPLEWREQIDWAGAIDEKPMQPMFPGALMEFCHPGEEVRSGYRRRLTETQGVVASSENSLGTTLIISRRTLKIPDEVSRLLLNTKKTWSLGQGVNVEEFEDNLTLYRALRQLACGFYYKWVWPNDVPDKEWLFARRRWHREVREFLQHRAKPGMDSPLLLAQAAATGRWQSETWGEWSRVKTRPSPETEAVWISDFVVQDATAWAEMSEVPGIIWYEYKAVGEKIAEVSGYPLYDAGMDASGAIADVIVASIKAQGTGKNLQKYSRNLIVTIPSSGATLEQVLGRTHRPGQQADEVTAEWYGHTPELIAAFDQARADASYIEKTQGSKQKLCYANYVNM